MYKKFNKGNIDVEGVSENLGFAAIKLIEADEQKEEKFEQAIFYIEHGIKYFTICYDENYFLILKTCLQEGIDTGRTTMYKFVDSDFKQNTRTIIDEFHLAGQHLCTSYKLDANEKI